MSKIEWTNQTWNPVVGCSKVSAGCKNCYAIGMAWRLMHIGHSKEKYAGTVEKTAGGQFNWTGNVNLIEKELVKPLSWKKPQMVFVNSESDLFHESIPFEFIDAVFRVMNDVDHHIYQVLTKRPARILDFYRWKYEQHHIHWRSKDNVWIGVSVEDQQAANERIPLLLQVPAAVRFLSCEPLLGRINFTLNHQIGPKSQWTEYHDVLVGHEYSHDLGNKGIAAKIHWVIAGGESGRNARPMHPDWVRSIRDQCNNAGTPFFFKQWGQWENIEVINGATHTLLADGKFLDGIVWGEPGCYDNRAFMKKSGKKAAGRLLDGREWNEMPNQKLQQNQSTDPDLYFTGVDY